MGVAIVGGGIAGCYSAYRLSGAGVGPIDIYEQSDRVGGRLWSVWLDACDAAPIELGGTFFSTLQSNVYGLVTNELKLPCTPVSWSRGQLFLRGKNVCDSRFNDKNERLFNFDTEERGRTPHGLLAYVLGRIVPDFPELWPFNQAPPASSSVTHARLRLSRHRGRPLHECGFWNVLSDVASNEAYQFLTSTIGSIGLFRSANAFDTIWNLLQELAPQEFYRIDAGYQSLAQSLWDAPGNEIGRHLEHRLTRLDRIKSAFRLSFETPAGTVRKNASRVILALPQRALQLVEFGDDVFADRRAFEQLRDQAVHPTPASKLFLSFDFPWWPNPSSDPAALSASYTDMPMQQCYCFGRAKSDAPAVLMASLADDVSQSFWRSLAGGSQAYRNPVRGAPPSLQCSDAIVECARQQLALLHGVDAVPAPNGAVFVNWERDPFGAGWHAWSTHTLSWEARKQIRSPVKDLFICGEAYAGRHGWVEGAINSAEMVVQLLGVGRPAWVDGSYVFEQEERGNNMSGQVSELLIALGESSALKRVYDRCPGQIMSAFGLDADAQEAVRSNDLARVKSAAGLDEAAFVIVKPAN